MQYTKHFGKALGFFGDESKCCTNKVIQITGDEKNLSLTGEIILWKYWFGSQLSNFVVFIFKSVTIRRAISKNHKASLISELCHDVSQKYTTAAGEVDVSNLTISML